MNRRLINHARGTRGGMSLLETMIAVSLSTMISIAFIQVMIEVEKGTAAALWYDETARESRQIADLISHDIRPAVGLDTTFGTFSNTTDTIILKIPSINSSGSVINASQFLDRIVFYPDSHSQAIDRQVSPNTASRLTSSTQVLGYSVSGVGSSYRGAFSTQPNALGASVIFYQFITTNPHDAIHYDQRLGVAIPGTGVTVTSWIEI